MAFSLRAGQHFYILSPPVGSYFIIWGEDFKNNFISRNSSFPGEKLFSGEKPFFRGEAIFWGEAIFGEKPFLGRSHFRGEAIYWGEANFKKKSKSA